MLQEINGKLEKYMPVVAPISVLLGLLLSKSLSLYAFLIPWVFAFMTFSGSLGSSFRDLKGAISRPAQILTALLVLHLMIPGAAFGLGHILFKHDPFTITGLILAVVIPTGITSLIWASNYQGDTALAFSIILIDALFSPLIVPYSLSLFANATVSIDVWGIMKGLLWMIVLPSILGMLLNEATSGRVKVSLGAPLAPFSKLGLAVVMAINSALIAPYLKAVDLKLLLIIAVILVLSSSGYLLGWFSGRILHWPREVKVTLAFCTGMRNISTGAVLAVSFFPAPVAIPVVISMLLQQLLAALCAYLLRYAPEREASS
ncbi:bile acid:sodium symporter family protein [Desulforamulus ruminis]|uniref:Bile acid:sodium symporter n=1 Tax=Desulforamulus ruminis (strain ATCC 23193 / DSM 2154 / NCIMB 8452 / DL) TaxID=696281 RepID=F6DRL1_DESRL|nr:bile acid:sodium symporter family protein [Desulforamulus ruminis]AEG58765.1 Bile acid:sodium symporter [Desulforamulus ruminis DSM 2154]